MHKISNFTGSARHAMGFGSGAQSMGRPPQDYTMQQNLKRQPITAAAMNPIAPAGTPVTLSFNVPFSSNLPGPDVESIIHATPGAFVSWTHPEGTEEGTPNHKLPVHVENVESLRRMCRQMSDNSNGQLQAAVTTAEPKPVKGLQRELKALATNVCISGESELVHRMRGKILNETPTCLRCATVDIDPHLIIDPTSNGFRANVLEHIDKCASYTGTDIFVLSPKQIDTDSVSFSSKMPDSAVNERLKFAIYGDIESSEHAKTRLLIMIDQILRRTIDCLKVENSLHFLVCGRFRKNIKFIESATNTAIYFPPPFTKLHGYTPPGANRRREDEVFLTGDNMDSILQAKKRLHDQILTVKGYVKDIELAPSKIDSILFERLDKVKKIMETNGTYVLFPQLGLQRSKVRVQGTEILHIERTIRELMALAGEYYTASWCITYPDPTQRTPTANDVRTMLSDICINSGADISFEKLNFHISGTDDAVKAALMIISMVPFVRKAQTQMRIKIELANDHKEFVSGKKNGKINKIMSQSNVQIIFDQFNEYNFCIDVCGPNYEATKNGLELVEQEMPASISFHVPDQYHKRIIGIGGSHIQRIMKKYSVFVKFSNAMDRGGLGKEDDDIKIDNVICRTPARNAQSLDLVKQEIMDMVEKADAEFTSEHVVIDRLYHRELIARMGEVEELEKKWNCKIVFPNTEEGSELVTVTGPEYQVPQAVDEFLGMVPDTHTIALPASEQMTAFLKSSTFKEDIVDKLKSQYMVDLIVNPSPPRFTAEKAQLPAKSSSESSLEQQLETLTLTYTRNNEGGLKDAIDFLISRLVARNPGMEASAIKGAIPRPKSDSFEDSLPFFDSKLLQRAEPPVGVTDSPTRSTFGDDQSDRASLFDRLRKPGSISSLSSFLDRRKNNGSAAGGAGSPAGSGFFRYASSNASKASLASLESQSSGYRNPWNDSGINLPPDDNSGHAISSHLHASSIDSAHPLKENKFPFATATSGPSLTSGESTPTFENSFHQGGNSVDGDRPGSSQSGTGYPAPIGPPSPRPHESN